MTVGSIATAFGERFRAARPDDLLDGEVRMPAADVRHDLGLIGVGPMGEPIARRLLARGPLTVWNRTRETALPLERLGATVAERPGGAARAIVLTVLPDLPQVAALLEGPDGLLAGWSRNGIERPVLVIHGTVSPTAVQEFARHCAERHRVAVLDAPLSGGTVGARAGTLSVMVGGDEAVAAELGAVFRVYGRTIRYLGPSGSGALAKACNQVVVAATVAAVSEALAMARAGGLDERVLVELLGNGLAGSRILEQKAEKWLSDDFAEGGSARNQLKDLRFAREAASRLGLPLSVTDAVAELFEAMVERGDGDLDHTGVLRTVLARASIAGP